MGVLEYSVWIEAAPELVWRAYVDPTRIPEWQTGRPVIGDVQGEFGVRARAMCQARMLVAARASAVCRELVTNGRRFGLSTWSLHAQR